MTASAGEPGGGDGHARRRLRRTLAGGLPRALGEATDFWVVARDLAEKGHWAGAVVLYRRALLLVPDHWQWRVELCNLLASVRRWDAALEVVDAPGVETPWEAQLLAASLLAQAGRSGPARDRLEAAWPTGTRPTHLRPGHGSAAWGDLAPEWLASALWHVGRHQDLLRLAEAVPAPAFTSHQPTLALAHAWRLLLAGRVADARTLFGPGRSFGVASVGDVPVRFAHRGLQWIAELAFRGVGQATATLPRPERPEDVPATVAAAFEPHGPLTGWAAVIQLGAGRDRDPHLGPEAIFALSVRAARAWRDLLRQLNPENSPARCCAARDEAVHATERDPDAAERLAGERARSVQRRLDARRSDRPCREHAVQTDRAVHAALERISRLQGPAVAEQLREAYAVETQATQVYKDGTDGAAATATPVDVRVKLVGHPAWRLLRLPLSATLDDLHGLIQGAFEWDNDHLYAFGFGPRERRPRPLFGGPGTEDDGTTDTTLAELRLRPGQRFWYIFDFGDDNRFSVSVVSVGVHPGPADKEPRILKEHGDAPEQYPGGEEW